MVEVTMKDNRGDGILCNRRDQYRRLILATFVWGSFLLGANLYKIQFIPSNNDIIGIDTTNNVDIDVPMQDVLQKDPIDMILSQYNLTQDVKARDILSASTNLINIGFISHGDVSVSDTSYQGLVAEFCPLNFTKQKDNPRDIETYQELIEASSCGKGSKDIIRVDLKEAMRLVREYDTYIAQRQNINDSTINTVRDNNIPTILDFRGAIFHEGRSGASLTAQSLMAIDTTKTRVYSEPSPPYTAMKICAEGFTECSISASANILQDVMYLMSRSNDSREENLFFIFQPEATRVLESFRMAFPTTPWLFLYRDSLDGMMSNTIRAGFSLKTSPMVDAFLEKTNLNEEDVTKTEMTAIQLATFRWSALRTLPESSGLGLAVEYSTSHTTKLIDTIIPAHFHIRLEKYRKRRIRLLSKMYDSERDGLEPRGSGSEDEHRMSEDIPRSVEKISKRFLEAPFVKLQKSRFNYYQCQYSKHGKGQNYLHCPDEDDEDSEDE